MHYNLGMQNIIFFGSDTYSSIALNQLLLSPICNKKFDIFAVITDRPKPVGKDQSLVQSAVEKLAKTRNLKVSYYPSNLDEMDNFIVELKNQSKDKNIFGLCASFDHLLPEEIIEIFNGNLYNLHPSLLPQYRNVSPVQYALALGDTQTGITLFRISVGIDNGEIIGQSEEAINQNDTTPTLTPRLFEKGAELFINFLSGIKSSIENTTSEQLIFTKRLTRDSGFVEWEIIQQLLTKKLVSASDTNNLLLNLRLSKSDASTPSILQDLVRALSPWPSVWTLVFTKKGKLRVTLESVIPEIKLKIAGKPKPISYSDFNKYYID